MKFDPEDQTVDIIIYLGLAVLCTLGAFAWESLFLFIFAMIWVIFFALAVLRYPGEGE